MSQRGVPAGPTTGPTEADLARALAHIRARTISHPEVGATGLWDMPDDLWRQCVARLRAAGHDIAEGIVSPADSACNATGYTLRPTPKD